jgi:DNA-binding response OmpR family regulator
MTRRILFVDDDASLRVPYAQVLTDAGFEVLSEGDPLRALDLLDRQDHIDLLITDIYLPVIHGFALANMARARRRGLRVLYISGSNVSDADANGDRILHKPIERDSFVREVTSLLDQTTVWPS